MDAPPPLILHVYTAHSLPLFGQKLYFIFNAIFRQIIAYFQITVSTLDAHSASTLLDHPVNPIFDRKLVISAFV